MGKQIIYSLEEKLEVLAYADKHSVSKAVEHFKGEWEQAPSMRSVDTWRKMRKAGKLKGVSKAKPRPPFKPKPADKVSDICAQCEKYKRVINMLMGE
jgi:hypothetical protein